MEPQPGCLPLALAFVLAIGAVFFATPSSTTVDVGEPVVIEVPAPSPT